MAINHSARNITHNTKMVFNRQEFKYFIPLQFAELIQAELDRHMDRDSFSEKGFYSIHSVYFDTHDWQAFYAKLDGILHRKKLRVRTYNSNPKQDEPIFVEIKEKDNREVLKRRVALPYSSIDEITRARSLAERSSVYDEWRYNILRNNLKPRLLNTYRRLAYSSRGLDELRVTIDKDVRYRLVDSVQFTAPTLPTYWSKYYCVMEVKFYTHIPFFLSDIIKQHNLTQVAISKYSDSIISNFLLT